MKQICPNCRSELELIGSFSFSAPGIQEIACPICQQKIWVSSGWLPPQVWHTVKVIKEFEGPIPPPQPSKQKPPQDPVFQPSMPPPIKKAFDVGFPHLKYLNLKENPLYKYGEDIQSGIKIGSIISVVLLVLILVVIFKR